MALHLHFNATGTQKNKIKHINDVYPTTPYVCPQLLFFLYANKTWADGTVYDGEWKDGKIHGQGKKTWADGTVYDGEWKDGNYHGQGKMTWATDGTVYDGEWKDDNMHGQGEFTSLDGTFKGEVKEGKPISVYRTGV